MEAARGAETSSGAEGDKTAALSHASSMASMATDMSVPSAGSSARALPHRSAVEPSIDIFRRFITRTLQSDASTVVDASGIFEPTCYMEWMRSRGSGHEHAQSRASMARIYQRTITGYVAAADGRRPFEPEEEAAVLLELRRKRVWPCFADKETSIGAKGYRGYGYHEKLRMVVALEATGSTITLPSHIKEAAEPRRKRARQPGTAADACVVNPSGDKPAAAAASSVADSSSSSHATVPPLHASSAESVPSDDMQRSTSPLPAAWLLFLTSPTPPPLTQPASPASRASPASQQSMISQ